MTCFLVVGFEIVVIAVIILTVLTGPPLSLERTAADAETQEEPDKRDNGENTKRQRLPFRSHICAEREQSTGEERADGSSAGGKGLGKTVECAENRIVGSRVGDLPQVSIVNTLRGSELHTYQQQSTGQTTDGGNGLHKQYEAHLDRHQQ